MHNIVNERCEFFGSCDHLGTTGNCNGCGNLHGHDERRRKMTSFENFVRYACECYGVPCEYVYDACKNTSSLKFGQGRLASCRFINWNSVSDIRKECIEVINILNERNPSAGKLKKENELMEYCLNDIKQTKEVLNMIHGINQFKIKNVIFNEPATIVFWEDGTKTVVKCQDGDIFDPEKGLTMAITKKVYGNKGNYCEEIKKWVNPYYAELEEADSIVDDFLAKLRKSCEDINEKLGFGFNRSTEMTKEESKALFKSCMDTISEDDVRRVECAFGKPIIKKDDSKCQE